MRPFILRECGPPDPFRTIIAEIDLKKRTALIDQDSKTGGVSIAVSTTDDSLVIRIICT